MEGSSACVILSIFLLASISYCTYLCRERRQEDSRNGTVMGNSNPAE